MEANTEWKIMVQERLDSGEFNYRNSYPNLQDLNVKQ